MNYSEIRTQLKRYNNSNHDREQCLYKIGKYTALFTGADVNQMQGGKLTPAMRSRVMAWLRKNANEIGLTSYK